MQLFLKMLCGKANSVNPEEQSDLGMHCLHSDQTVWSGYALFVWSGYVILLNILVFEILGLLL